MSMRSFVMARAESRLQGLARARRWLLLACAGLAWFALDGLARWRERHALLINASTSLPNWAFVVERGKTPRRGDLVFFMPRASTLLERHFGTEPRPFGKIVHGIAGDTVERRGAEFLVNDYPVARAKPRTRRGEPLTPGPTGVIPAGCLFVATPHPDSFDSRYAEIGWVCGAQIIGVGKKAIL